MRLIDKDALIQALKKEAPPPTTDDLYTVNLLIVSAPIIDAIPVSWITAQEYSEDEELSVAANVVVRAWLMREGEGPSTPLRCAQDDTWRANVDCGCLYCRDYWEYHKPGHIIGKPMKFQRTGGETDFKDASLYFREDEAPCMMAFDTLGRAAFIDFNYCPMCGRDLREKEGWHENL